MTGTTSLRFKTKRLSINAQNIGTLARMENPRPLRETHVAELVHIGKAGIPFEGSFAVNDVGGGGRERFRLIDGNHRLDAVRRILQDDPSFRAEAEFHIYDHLTEAQELAVFDAINGVVPPTLLDRIIARRAHLPIIELLETDFPCTVAFTNAPMKEGFHGLALLRGYIPRHSQSPMRIGSRTDGRAKLFAAVGALTAKDHHAMKQFAQTFIDGLGMPGIQNPFSSYTGLHAAMKTYFTNVDSGALTPDDIVKRWNDAVRGDERFRMAVANTSIHAMKFTCDLMVTKMNSGHRKNLAITTTEYAALQGGKVP
jgi:hypothetical protein